MHMNILKTVIYPNNSIPNIEELAGIVCGNIGSFVITYLGFPFGATFRSTDNWNSMIEFKRRLETLKMQCLYMQGRLI